MKIYDKKYNFESINSLPVLLRNPKILLIGAGNVAYQKAKVLYENNIKFNVIAKSINNKFLNIPIKIVEKEISKVDFANYNIIIDASNNNDVHQLLNEERIKRFLLNTVDIPSKCDFYFSALLQFGKLKVAVSSDGASPTISQNVRSIIENYLPKELETLTEITSLNRKNHFIDIEETKKQLNLITGKVYFVGAGPGSTDLLTIKAYKLIKSADIILYDYLISEEIKSEFDKNAKAISVGKPCGKKNITQEKINQQLVHYAKQGNKVIRLKSGDPSIFGRLLEETNELVKNNISFDIVPGISSAIAGPASIGIPLTARNVSSNFSIVSGCLAGNKFNDNWIELLKIPKHTTIVLMGLKKIREIKKTAMFIGVNELLPAAIISNISRENQKTIFTNFKNICNDSIDVEQPAIIIFGEIIKHAKSETELNKIIYSKVG